VDDQSTISQHLNIHDETNLITSDCKDKQSKQQTDNDENDGMYSVCNNHTQADCTGTASTILTSYNDALQYLD